MKVSGFYRRTAPTVQPGNSLREAASKMRAGGFSCLPVVAGSHVVGIITERDLVEALGRGESIAREAHVGDYMSDGSVTVSLEDDIAVALVKMLAIGCRHLPVTEDGRLVGMVSSRDLFLSAVREEAAAV